MGEEPGRAYLLPEKGLQGGAGTDLSLPHKLEREAGKQSRPIPLACCPWPSVPVSLIKIPPPPCPQGPLRQRETQDPCRQAGVREEDGKEGGGRGREGEGETEGQRPSIREWRQVGRRTPRSLVCIPSQSSLMPAFQACPCPHVPSEAEVFIGDREHLGGQGDFSLTTNLVSALPEEADPAAAPTSGCARGRSLCLSSP